jgi:hypothetical protein
LAVVSSSILIISVPSNNVGGLPIGICWSWHPS